MTFNEREAFVYTNHELHGKELNSLFIFQVCKPNTNSWISQTPLRIFRAHLPKPHPTRFMAPKIPQKSLCRIQTREIGWLKEDMTQRVARL